MREEDAHTHTHTIWAKCGIMTVCVTCVCQNARHCGVLKGCWDTLTDCVCTHKQKGGLYLHLTLQQRQITRLHADTKAHLAKTGRG